MVIHCLDDAANRVIPHVTQKLDYIACALSGRGTIDHLRVGEDDYIQKAAIYLMILSREFLKEGEDSHYLIDYVKYVIQQRGGKTKITDGKEFAKTFTEFHTEVKRLWENDYSREPELNRCAEHILAEFADGLTIALYIKDFKKELKYQGH